MAELHPIPERNWIRNYVGPKHLQHMFGTIALRLGYLPVVNVMPEDFLKVKVLDVEIMLACLKAGAWLGAEEWQPYARVTIGQRLRARGEILFTPPFDGIREKFLEWQLNGGTYKLQGELKKFVASVLRHPHATPFMMAGCRLILSTLDPIQDNTLIQPFHWIRATLAHSESCPTYGMTFYNSEMHLQKTALCRVLRQLRSSELVS